jgi:hypothetical protein
VFLRLEKVTWTDFAPFAFSRQRESQFCMELRLFCNFREAVTGFGFEFSVKLSGS